jgi:hypothetical protein
MMRSAAVVLLCLAACGPLARGKGEADSGRLTLCVQNETVAYGNIVARAALVRFDVQPGEQVCKPVIATGPAIELRATTMGGGVAGPLSYATRLDVGGSSCWRWRLTDAPASAVDLMPCDLVSDDDADMTAADTVPADSGGVRAREERR